LQPQKAVTQH